MRRISTYTHLPKAVASLRKRAAKAGQGRTIYFTETAAQGGNGRATRFFISYYGDQSIYDITSIVARKTGRNINNGAIYSKTTPQTIGREFSLAILDIGQQFDLQPVPCLYAPEEVKS